MSRSDGAKMVVLVRADLGMSVGKIVAQSIHAALDVVKLAKSQHLATWRNTGETVITLSVADLEELNWCIEEANKAGIPAIRVTDQGRTEVAPNTVTVGALGPAPNVSIDQICKTLKLLR